MYTKEQNEYLKNNINNTPYKTLTDMFNFEFNTNKSIVAIRRKCEAMGLKNNVSCKFKKGKEPWNKVVSFDSGGNSHGTRFKKGQKAINYREIGSERIGRDGYTYIKIGDPNIWRSKQQLVWEKYSNKIIPKNHVVIFCDRNKENFNESNLMCVSRGVLAIMNKRGRIDTNPDITKCYSTLTELEMLTRKMED